jgi:D-alanyl-D-alanine carboxypeptidase
VHQEQRTSNGSSVVPGTSYDLTIFNVNGWLGRNGDIPGYTTVVVYLSERDASLVVFVNSDVPEQHSAGQIAYDVTSFVTPDDLYNWRRSLPEFLGEPGD